MNKRLRFSIITCTWNSATTLGETIASVACQTHPSVEHVFVDGGSQDGTLDMIARLCPSATVVTGIGGGISRAMNAGIDASTGDVIAHLHSDDYYTGADVLERVEVALVGSGRQWAFGKILVLNGGTLSDEPISGLPFSFSTYVAGGVSVPHPATFVRRAAFAEVGYFDPSLKYAMDIDMWLRLGQRHLPAQLDFPLTVFREHAGSLSSANKLAARREEWAVRQRYARHAPLHATVYTLRYLLRTRRLKRQLALEDT